jgi:DedD protein
MAEKELGESLGNSPDSPSEIALQIKKRARRRLVGAIALALLAIIALPMVMDREPAPGGPEIQVRIPSQEGSGMVGKIAPGAVVTATPLTSPAKPAVAASVEPTAPTVTESKTEPVPVAETKPTVETKAVAAVPLKADAAKADKARAEAALAGETPPAKATQAAALTNSSGWVVQLGAYQSAGNVSILMAKLKEMRIPAYTEKMDTPQGARTRVRAGPFKTKEAAQAAQTRIKIINVNGPVAPASADGK